MAEGPSLVQPFLFQQFAMQTSANLHGESRFCAGGRGPNRRTPTGPPRPPRPDLLGALAVVRLAAAAAAARRRAGSEASRSCGTTYGHIAAKWLFSGS